MFYKTINIRHIHDLYPQIYQFRYILFDSLMKYLHLCLNKNIVFFLYVYSTKLKINADQQKTRVRVCMAKIIIKF